MLKLDHKVVIGYTTINVIGVTTVFVKNPIFLTTVFVIAKPQSCYSSTTVNVKARPQSCYRLHHNKCYRGDHSIC